MGDGAVPGQIDELGAWLWSADARAAARADLRRLALPHGSAQVDDVLGGVALRVFARLTGAGALDGSVVAYARRAVANAALDLAGGHHERSLDELLTGGEDGPLLAEPADPGPDAADRLADDEALLAVRLALHAALRAPRAEAWPVAAGLALATLSQGDVSPAPDLPRPDEEHGGAGQAELWAALAYAGQDRCFEQPDTPAVRTRRSTAGKRVRTTLGRALESARALGLGAEAP